MARARGKRPDGAWNHWGMTDQEYQEALARDKAMVDLEASMMGYSTEEWMRWKIEHVTLFGHGPDPDFVRGITCRHPMHHEAARMISGANLTSLKDQFHPRTERTLDDDDIPGARADHDASASRPRTFTDEA